MALQINVHRSIEYGTFTRAPWEISFHDHDSFSVVKIQCSSDSVTFFDNDMEQFMNDLLAAWDEFKGRSGDNEL